MEDFHEQISLDREHFQRAHSTIASFQSFLETSPHAAFALRAQQSDMQRQLSALMAANQRPSWGPAASAASSSSLDSPLSLLNSGPNRVLTPHVFPISATLMAPVTTTTPTSMKEFFDVCHGRHVTSLIPPRSGLAHFTLALPQHGICLTQTIVHPLQELRDLQRFLQLLAVRGESAVFSVSRSLLAGSQASTTGKLITEVPYADFRLEISDRLMDINAFVASTGGLLSRGNWNFVSNFKPLFANQQSGHDNSVAAPHVAPTGANSKGEDSSPSTLRMAISLTPYCVTEEPDECSPSSSDGSTPTSVRSPVGCASDSDQSMDCAFVGFDQEDDSDEIMVPIGLKQRSKSAPTVR